jgi:hypothetical protein
MTSFFDIRLIFQHDLNESNTGSVVQVLAARKLTNETTRKKPTFFFSRAERKGSKKVLDYNRHILVVSGG